jgi:hypothetical protein
MSHVENKPKFIYELFYQNPDNASLIEVFNCYDSRYGKIFFNGKLIYHFYKESYDDVLETYKVVKSLKKAKINVAKTKTLIYDIESLRDFESTMTVFDAELAIDLSYEQLLQAMTQDKNSIEKAIEENEKQSKYYKFLKVQAFNIDD